MCMYICRDIERMVHIEITWKKEEIYIYIYIYKRETKTTYTNKTRSENRYIEKKYIYILRRGGREREKRN